VITQFARYPKADRLAYREGRIDGPMFTLAAQIP